MRRTKKEESEPASAPGFVLMKGAKCEATFDFTGASKEVRWSASIHAYIFYRIFLFARETFLQLKTRQRIQIGLSQRTNRANPE